MAVMLILMFLPLIAIPAFWFLPLGQAIPFYGVCILLSALMFLIMHRTMRRPVTTGVESIIGKEAEVISRSGSHRGIPYMVRIEGELWSARSRDSLQPGETVMIVGVKGNYLTVEHKDADIVKTEPA
jgi:membrane protein implicated in regulation of membrane protease activity